MCSKFLIFTLAVLAICSFIGSLQTLDIPEVVKKQVKKLHLRCVNQTGVSEELMNEAHKGVLPNDPLFKCFMHCMLDMFGLIDSDNVMHLDALTEVLPVELHAKIKALTDACGTIKGVDGCDTAYLAVKCYIETDGPFIRDAVNDIMG